MKITCAIFGLAAFAAGCSGSPSSPADAGTGTDSGPSPTVVFYETPGAAPLDAGPLSYTVSFQVIAFDTVAGCAQQTGACCFLPSATAFYSGPVIGSAVTANAGTLSVTDTTASPPAPVGTLSDGPQGYGTLLNPDSLYDGGTWGFGDELAVSASGGSALGAFTGTIKAVPAIVGVNPPLVFGAGLAVPRNAPFQLQWAPDTAGAPGQTVVVPEAVIVAMSGNEGTIVCTALDAAATVTVPSTLLSNFAPQTALMTLYRQGTAVTSSAQVNLMSVTDLSGYANYQ